MKRQRAIFGAFYVWKNMEKKLIGNESIDLKLALIDSAQCFSWIEYKDGFAGILQGKPVHLYQTAGEIYAEGEIEAETVRHFLDLDRDYRAVAAEYAHIPAAKRAIELYPGMRVLNQDPWEALLSFILSANNNVTRIRNLVAALCRAFGEGVSVGDRQLYGFPAPERLAAAEESALRALGVGYRAPYLKKTARMVCDGFPLYQLKDMPYEEAHCRLTTLCGVGDKVADCILLFGCGHTSAFPVDVWVERLLNSWFGIVEKDRKKLRKAARELLGEHAGLLQQFLFHAARVGDIEL